MRGRARGWWARFDGADRLALGLGLAALVATAVLLAGHLAGP